MESRAGIRNLVGDTSAFQDTMNLPTPSGFAERGTRCHMCGKAGRGRAGERGRWGLGSAAVSLGRDMWSVRVMWKEDWLSTDLVGWHFCRKNKRIKDIGTGKHGTLQGSGL